MAPFDDSNAHGTGSPPQSSILAEDELTTAQSGRTRRADAPAGAQTYRILITNQTEGASVSMADAATFAPATDDFCGAERREAKLSISTANTEQFADIENLVATLPSDRAMMANGPDDVTSGRMNEENRNVSVRAFLYAAIRESDNSFRLVIGRDPKLSAMYMHANIAGLPPKVSNSFARIKFARDAFTHFFGAKLPGITYHFYRPPIPVEITGSLFFGMSHTTGRPGPRDLRGQLPTYWEIYPVTDVLFEPQGFHHA